MMNYTSLQNDRRKFLAMTGLTVREFQQVLPAFTRAYRDSIQQPNGRRPAPTPPIGGGRKGSAATRG